MARRRRIAPLWAWAAPLIFAACAPVGPPNVVLIISDDHGWTDFGFLDHAVVETPNLDRLASQGLVFPRGYVPSSLCRPSLATLITGLYPHQHGVSTNDPPAPRPEPGRSGRPDPRWVRQNAQMTEQFARSPSLPRLLAEAGYVSFQAGKWWEGHYSRGGFTHGMSHGNPERGGRHGDEGLAIGRETMQPVFDFIDEAQSRGERFFLWYAPFLPHVPHDPPRRLFDKYWEKTPSIPLARYWAMVGWFDETCGQLLDYLDEKGLDDDTLVVFVADNGWMQRVNATGRHTPRSKGSPYDGGVRTPIVLRWPREIRPRTDDTPVSSIDLAPTILRAAGVEPPAEMPGIDLLDPEARSRRKTIFGEVFEGVATDIHRPAANLKYRWAVRDRWKLIVPNPAAVPTAKVELFDVVADPREKKNLASQHPERVGQMRRAIDAWWAAEDADPSSRRPKGQGNDRR